jgi:hypothetical protein
MRPEKWTVSGTASTGTGYSEVDLSPQYSAKTLRLRTIIVQLFTIKVIPDKLHGVYQLQ